MVDTLVFVESYAERIPLAPVAPIIPEDFRKNYKHLLAFYSRERGADVEARNIAKRSLM